MQHDEIVKQIRVVTQEVLSTMFGLEVQSGEAVVEQAAPGPTNGVVALVGLAGAWVGTGSVSCSAEMACKLSSQFLMSECESVNDEVLDTVGELTNMIIGNFKAVLEDELGPMGLSIPTVIYGRNFTTRTLGKSDFTLIPFTCSQGSFDIHICLAPNSKQPPHPVHPAHTQLQDVTG
jgi:chemotaxis protein CheX